jgi:hypothetical protein
MLTLERARIVDSSRSRPFLDGGSANGSATQASRVHPARGEPRLVHCEPCDHQHVYYVADRLAQSGPRGRAWVHYFFACLGCPMPAAGPTARTNRAECVLPA